MWLRVRTQARPELFLADDPQLRLKHMRRGYPREPVRQPQKVSGRAAYRARATAGT